MAISSTTEDPTGTEDTALVKDLRLATDPSIIQEEPACMEADEESDEEASYIDDVFEESWEDIRDMNNDDLDEMLWVWAEDFMIHFTRRDSIPEPILRDTEAIFKGLEARPGLDLDLIMESRIHAAMVAIGMLPDNESMFPHRARGLVLKWEYEHPELRHERWNRIPSKWILVIVPMKWKYLH
ncbi:hypothetical protein N7492_009060 [Penicillium capsulatum]|uniref:Uncharacterized protein n=1 Tax=Penicillium capsulatum TaxID=69766 RepID=A0A9W9HSB3_9EURO|nr:hypothetical protein N7492_009060 [Penicillium capsulatum]KAJ6106459.1 hypothetical protein N7512_009976 [Penicillium capsulatum]